MLSFKSYLEETSELDEGLKSKIAGAALAGMAALGSHNAHANDLSTFSHDYLHQVATGTHSRPMISQDAAKKEIERRDSAGTHVHIPQKTTYKPSKEYLQRIASGNHPRPMISKDEAKELLKKHYPDE